MPDDISLLDLSRSCFVAVGPARIAACALTLLTDDTSDTATTAARYTMSADRIRAAAHMLSKVFPDQIEEAGHIVSSDLDDARRAALDCLMPIASAVDGPLSDLDRKMQGRANFRDYFFTSVEPVITRFLEVMTAELTQADAQKRAAHRAKALMSIENASGVGRAISMIAVNASIEASRSGDRGFRVIADEIKHLATETQKILGEVGDAMRHQ